MRFTACTVLALAALGCAAGARAESADLRISLWPHGRGKGDIRSWTLRCDPVGGTLPSARLACRRLAALEAPFRPVPPAAACTQIYGGPALGLVRGTFRGAPVYTFFRRSDGCEIERWNRVRFLFPTLIVRRP